MKVKVKIPASIHGPEREVFGTVTEVILEDGERLTVHNGNVEIFETSPCEGKA